jgi:hypothetical protein
MKRLWMSGAAAVMAISIAGLGAQTPQNPPQTPPPTTQPPTTQPPMTQPPAAPATAQNMETKTIQGCVYKEEAVPGRTPNVAEKAGILEDYILVASADTSAETVGTTGTTPPAAGAATPMPKAFKLEKISDDKLRAVVGKRVEVTGTMDIERSDTKGAGTTGAPAADKSVGPDEIELPEFEVESLREIEGACPATPNIRK